MAHRPSSGSIAGNVPAPWLAAWVADELRRGSARRTELTGVEGDVMHIYDSIGVDAALTATGEVWVGEYDFDTVEGSAATVTWHRAIGLERLGFIVIASRHFAALRDLLPARPPEATNCPACRATGDWHVFSADRKESLRIRGMICKACGGMGWRAGMAA
jgi:hypothetical protein